jgi:hypothetical protein
VRHDRVCNKQERWPFETRCRTTRATKEVAVPVLIVPILWTVGGIAVLGGGYYVIAHMIH